MAPNTGSSLNTPHETDVAVLRVVFCRTQSSMRDCTRSIVIDETVKTRQTLISFQRKIPVVCAAGRFLAGADWLIRERRLQRILVMRCFLLS